MYTYIDTQRYQTSHSEHSIRAVNQDMQCNHESRHENTNTNHETYGPSILWSLGIQKLEVPEKNKIKKVTYHRD